MRNRAKLRLLIGGPWGRGAGSKEPVRASRNQGACVQRAGCKGGQGKDGLSQEVMEAGQSHKGAQGWGLGEASTSKSSPPKEGVAAGAEL